ncbi:MAG TPA: hypothetical protein VJN62_13625 [Gemmatimonadales bacterium]|nr:hypothetical protein [Gemmatimonadales bacterium]
MHTPLRLGREDVAGSGCYPTRAPRAAGSKSGHGRSEGRSAPRGWLAPPAPPSDASLWRRFTDDRDLVGMKIALLVAIGILAALIDLVE